MTTPGKKRALTLGTRGSALALWQARHIEKRLRGVGATVDLRIIKTRGDQMLDVPLAKVGGKGLFVKELEDALLAGTIDLAIHSMKDVPGTLPSGLAIVATSSREDPSDALVLPAGAKASSLDGLPAGARLGTSSLRRACQLRTRRPDLTLVPLRGNVDTRLRKLDAGELDAIVLASAGLIRLGLGQRITARLAPPGFLPAIGQGALAAECRSDDTEVRELLWRCLHDEPTARAVAAERALLRTLGGDCQTPLAGFGTWSDPETLHLVGFVGAADGSATLRRERSDRVASIEQAEATGESLARALLDGGAAELLACARRHADAALDPA
jgi:hydroxymethylbilane synthase